MTQSEEIRCQLRRCPKELGTGGRTLWRSVASIWVLRPDELRILGEAAGEADLIDRLQEAVRLGPLTAVGSQGQPVAAPCVSELRQHRTVLASLLKQLHLPEDAEEDEGLTAGQRSAAARAAARARWDGPRRTGGDRRGA